MNVLTIVPDRRAPSCRFRILQYLELLGEEGIHLKVEELAPFARERWKQFARAGDYDAVLLHRKLLNWFDFGVLRRSARRLIYEFDDAVMFRDSNVAHPRSRSRLKKFKRLVSGVDLVIAGNGYLNKWARHYNHRTVVIPTAVDLALFPREPVPGDGNVIGWMGTRTNFVYLQPVAGPLRELRREKPEVRFKLVSDGSMEMAGVNIEQKPWSREDEVADLCGFDIGIMPLFSDPWAKGKCALKIIQYFAAFLPVVCSPVGTNREVVTDKVNGYFALTSDEWKNRLVELLAVPTRREEMGRAGRRLVEEKYSLPKVAPKLMAALQQAVK